MLKNNMAKTKTEISLGDVLRFVKKLPDEDKRKVREAIMPKKHWLKQMYDLFKDVRDDAKKYPEDEVNRIIDQAFHEVRKK